MTEWNDPLHQPGSALASTLHLTLLGHFRLLRGGQFLLPAAPARLIELVAYLVLHPRQDLARRDLAFLLWPDTSQAQAQANLRKLLHHLRAAWPQADCVVQVEARHLRWQANAPITCDVQTFEAALAQAGQAVAAGDEPGEQLALQQAVAVYGGDLLPQSGAEWLLPVRERLRRAFFTA